MLKLFKKLHFKYLLWQAKREDPSFEWTEEDEEMARDIEENWAPFMMRFLKLDLDTRINTGENSFEILSEKENEA